MNKETFLKQKINNFIIFIEKKIGKENLIYTEFVGYLNNMNGFLLDISNINKLADFKDNNKSEESINKYLDYKGVKAKLTKKDIEMIRRYFECFIKIIDS